MKTKFLIYLPIFGTIIITVSCGPSKEEIEKQNKIKALTEEYVKDSLELSGGNKDFTRQQNNLISVNEVYYPTGQEFEERETVFDNITKNQICFTDLKRDGIVVFFDPATSKIFLEIHRNEYETNPGALNNFGVSYFTFYDNEESGNVTVNANEKTHNIVTRLGGANIRLNNEPARTVAYLSSELGERISSNDSVYMRHHVGIFNGDFKSFQSVFVIHDVDDQLIHLKGTTGVVGFIKKIAQRIKNNEKDIRIYATSLAIDHEGFLLSETDKKLIIGLYNLLSLIDSIKKLKSQILELGGSIPGNTSGGIQNESSSEGMSQTFSADLKEYYGIYRGTEGDKDNFSIEEDGAEKGKAVIYFGYGASWSLLSVDATGKINAEKSDTHEKTDFGRFIRRKDGKYDLEHTGNGGKEIYKYSPQ